MDNWEDSLLKRCIVGYCREEIKENLDFLSLEDGPQQTGRKLLKLASMNSMVTYFCLNSQTETWQSKLTRAMEIEELQHLSGMVELIDRGSIPDSPTVG